MRIGLRFKDQVVFEFFPYIPRQGDFIQSDAFDCELQVKRVVWTQKDVFLDLLDPTGGHTWVQSPALKEWQGDSTEWRCSKCGWIVLSDVILGHSEFPSHDGKRIHIGDCDEEVVMSVLIS